MRLTKLLYSILLIASFSASAQDTGPKPLDASDWPTTLSATLLDLDKTLPQNTKSELRQMREEDLAMTHFGLGLYVRNHYGLWRGNKALILDVCKARYCHPDDASGRIIRAYWKKLRTEG